MKDVKFYKSPTGKVLVCVADNGAEEHFPELKAGAVDAALEKHVPVVETKDGKTVVTVGAVEHPMLDNHYIQFIALNSERGLEAKALNPGEKPVATFEAVEHGVAYEYCNLHGLWKKEF